VNYYTKRHTQNTLHLQDTVINI